MNYFVFVCLLLFFFFFLSFPTQTVDYRYRFASCVNMSSASQQLYMGYTYTIIAGYEYTGAASHFHDLLPAEIEASE